MEKIAEQSLLLLLSFTVANGVRALAGEKG